MAFNHSGPRSFAITMPDKISKTARSKLMSNIKGKDTRPEILIRKALHRHGFRYRIHVKEMPGRPDLVFPKRNAVILVQGCFWHAHQCHIFRFTLYIPHFPHHTGLTFPAPHFLHHIFHTTLVSHFQHHIVCTAPVSHFQLTFFTPHLYNINVFYRDGAPNRL